MEWEKDILIFGEEAYLANISQTVVRMFYMMRADMKIDMRMILYIYGHLMRIFFFMRIQLKNYFLMLSYLVEFCFFQYSNEKFSIFFNKYKILILKI